MSHAWKQKTLAFSTSMSHGTCDLGFRDDVGLARLSGVALGYHHKAAAAAVADATASPKTFLCC